ncbi:MAG: CRTAC1 family protein [Planctomycetota bacterium]
MARILGIVVVAAFCFQSGSAQTFSSATATSGIVIPAYPFAANVSWGRGCTWNDFDNDGDQDVFVGEGLGGDYAIWWNQGTGGFIKQVILADPGTPRFDHQAVSADFDNDGDADIFVAVGNYFPNLLFVNQGGGVFVEDAAARGLAHAGDATSANWGDYDRDGWLDLYVGNHYDASGASGLFAPNLLYRNNGNGTFTDVTIGAGAASPGLALATLMHDIDNDGWPDIVVGNDKGHLFLPVDILKNQRNGTFSSVAAAWNGAAAVDAMGLAVTDIDNSGGGWDLFATDVPSYNLLMVWNNAGGGYLPQGNWDQTGMTFGCSCTGNAWSCGFGDLDRDGFADLYYSQNGASIRYLKNTGGAPFVDRTAVSGLGTVGPPAYSSCLIDYDDDGDLDIFVPGDGIPAQLIQNNVQTNNWLRVKLVGTLSNRDGFGAVVICRQGGTRQRRVKLSGEGYLSDGDKRLHFGLGASAVVNEIEVRWPSGTVQYVSAVAANQEITITEASFQITGTLAPGTSNPVGLHLPADAYIPYVCGLTTNVFTEYPLGDGRSVLTNVTDPLLALTTIPGNSGFVDSVGFFDATGLASMTLNIPPVPGLSGFHCWMIGVSWHPLYVSNIKSIVGPQRIQIP